MTVSNDGQFERGNVTSVAGRQTGPPGAGGAEKNRPPGAVLRHPQG